MSDVLTTARPRPMTLALRTAARWMLTFAAFPLGSVAAGLVPGPVDGPAPALVGGLVSGAAVGAAQAWALGRRRPPAVRWVLATSLGLAAGLWLGAGAVGYGTDLASLVVQGAVCGAAVGVAQAVVLVPRLGALALAWPVLLSAAWALGWAVTYAAGVQVEEQFTVFGSSGAVIVTALTLALPAALARSGRRVGS